MERALFLPINKKNKEKFKDDNYYYKEFEKDDIYQQLFNYFFVKLLI